ncbi:nucleotidyltransferase domain-containing protein [Bradyrhizobium sp. SZCCHNRI3043]|uniref:nucleotidyltransferase domain-containing protein n=1 Tax=Bradyrhizobium sp. SZCCHNRI3043 TaxID=3057292 RepID=UPI0028E5581E|nr:nucleotidyltransferase domain-containing protein [Bradyrhizobium sp. SZCCHNRI3043]
MPDPLLTRIVGELADVPGLRAIALGGSRARGTAQAGSDYDVGLYIASRHDLDTDALREAVRRLVDAPQTVELTAVGGWDSGSSAAAGSESTGTRSTCSIARSMQSAA